MKTYWHIWLIGLLTLAWNSMGALDYFMTQSRNESYMAQFSQEQLSFFYGFPLWVDATWAIAVWFSVAGSLLILLQSRYAALVLGISLLAMIATSIHNFLLSDIKMQEVVGAEALYFTVVIFIVAWHRGFMRRGWSREVCCPDARIRKFDSEPVRKCDSGHASLL